MNSDNTADSSNVQENLADANHLEIESIVDFTFKNLTDAGMQFGHKVERTNRRMMPYIYSEKDGMYVINLGKTIPLLKEALREIRKKVARNGKILFVGTKHQSKQAVKEAAQQCAQYFISQKWLGGLLTNWGTVLKSIKTMKDMEKKLEEGFYSKYKKHEQIKIKRKYQKLVNLFEGIRDMNGLPDLIIITSCNEKTAINEAKILNIPIVLLLDTDGDPKGITFPVPGNDDSSIAVDLFCTLCSRACLLGIHDEQEILKKKEALKQQREDETKDDEHNQSEIEENKGE
ncbi:MAG: 30S ribosomal protein S2 [Alphaproteobacteria bacterium]|nr:MAG: 30S ribosomal protein S2 [Alphaproteobacteria bacterium]